MKNTKLGTLLIFLIAVGLAAAQTPLTYTAPVGTVHCLNKLGQLPAITHGCVIGGLVAASGTQTGKFETQNDTAFTFRIDPGQPPYEEVVLGYGAWNPTVTPARGVPALFSFDANLSDVCLAECGSASGTFHLEGQFSWQYKVSFVCGRQCYPIPYQEWTNTTPVEVTILDQSTVAILD